jgi:hypothetical protein
MNEDKKSPRPPLFAGSNVSIGTKYGYGMEITDEREAADYFEACVKHTMSFGVSRAEAERIERVNFGYYAGYYDHATRLRVEKLFACEHPMFGAASAGPVDPGKALLTGMAMASQGVEVAAQLSKPARDR